MGNSWDFFENINEVVYVADIETHTLVYMNRKALDVFGIDLLEQVQGKSCHQVLRSCDTPCSFCRSNRSKPGHFEQRRYFNQHLNRYFLLRDTILKEQGRLYRLEMALDLSGQGTQGTMQTVQNLEAIINEGLRVALLEKTPDRSLEVLLAYLGMALNGERTYIFERNESGNDDNTYEWTAEGVTPEKYSLQNVPAEVCADWYQNFREGRPIVINDPEVIRQSNPLLHEKLERQNIRSLVAAPLYDEGEIIGFYGVDNPPEQSLDYALNMLQITAHFIVSSLRWRNLVRELQKRSYNVLYALNVDYLAIYQVDFDTGVCEVYRESERLRGEPEVCFESGYQEAMERYITLCVKPQDQARLRTMTKKDYILAMLKKKRRFYIRYQVKENLQKLKHIELHFSTAGKSAGEHSAIFAFRDVNAVVEQEERYRLETRRDIENILEGARTGIWTIELEDGFPPRMYADRTMRMLLGAPEDVEPEACYRLWFEHIEKNYVGMVQEAVQEMVRTGRTEVVYPWNHPKLGKIYVRCGGVPDKTFEKPGVCLRGYHQDITETMVTRKKQDQAIMELLEKVRQANSAKSEFLSHMSHDLRTPIHGILGMLAMMEKSEADLETQRTCREKIRLSTEHLLSLVNSVLEISRLDSGRPEVVEDPFDLLDILNACIVLISSKAENVGIRTALEETRITHRKLLGNPLQIKQILMNILDNAVKYNRPHGSVSVRAEELSCRDDRGEFQFVIQDTGIGIGEEFQSHIFEPFAQEHPDARTDYCGAGVGLSIAKKLTDQMGGTIEVESRLQHGSLFRVTLPLSVDPAQEKPQEEEPGISGMRVLLVEDNALNCEIMQFILEDAGAEVETAENGRAAVDAFANSGQGTVDCILMDLMMPVMSGLEAARVIRGMDRPDAGTVPIIALSANAFEEDMAMSRSAGMDAHLPKPVDIGKMFRTMRKLRKDRGLR